MKTARFNSHMFHKVFQQGEFPACIIITFQVMAFTRMSPRHPDGVGTLTEGRQNEFGTHPARAGNPDDPNIGWIFHAADARKIGGAVAAPVTQKTQDFRLVFSHFSCLLIL